MQVTTARESTSVPRPTFTCSLGWISAKTLDSAKQVCPYDNIAYKAISWKLEFQKVGKIFPDVCADLFCPILGFSGFAEMPVGFLCCCFVLLFFFEGWGVGFLEGLGWGELARSFGLSFWVFLCVFGLGPSSPNPSCFWFSFWFYPSWFLVRRQKRSISCSVTWFWSFFPFFKCFLFWFVFFLFFLFLLSFVHLHPFHYFIFFLPVFFNLHIFQYFGHFLFSKTIFQTFPVSNSSRSILFCCFFCFVFCFVVLKKTFVWRQRLQPNGGFFNKPLFQKCQKLVLFWFAYCVSFQRCFPENTLFVVSEIAISNFEYKRPILAQFWLKIRAFWART